MNSNDYFKKFEKDPEYQEAEQKYKLILDLADEILRLRMEKGWSQAELAKRSGISATNLSLLENDRVEIGKRRVEQLAKAFDVHPAIIMFPEYEAKEIQKAA